MRIKVANEKNVWELILVTKKFIKDRVRGGTTWVAINVNYEARGVINMNANT